jgi:hypothetical protein
MDKLMTSTPQEWNVPPAPSGQVVHNIGPINNITLPADWRPGRSKHRVLGQSAYEEYTPPNDPDVCFFFFYRGLPLEPETARAFAAILRQPPHSLQPAEFESIKPVLRGKENRQQFEINGIQTQNLNGRVVLAITGLYKEDQKQMLSMLVDADGSGAVVEEIEFMAPKDKYAQYLPQAQNAMRSVCWK